MASHARRRQVVFGGIGKEGSSESDSKGAEDGTAGGNGGDVRAFSVFGGSLLVAMGFGGGGTSSGTSAGEGGSGLSVSSIAECFPVVQGGIERNSSNVKTRGLQQFQPKSWKSVNMQYIRTGYSEGVQTPFCPS